ncbi:MAG: YcgN family cysteine cluster protein [Gammaproteobacteria bacterium]|nr:YcgN family cysteine cluster protein [Gammaproteobacteria bacterium]
MTAFWEEKTLEQMTRDEWESLCDGCARCCLHKLEDIDTGDHYYTAVACRLLDIKTCRCRDYPGRKVQVQDCLVLTPADTRQFAWLPLSCAYRRIAEHRSLDWWHPLVSGDPDTVHQAGISVRGHTLSEADIDPDDLQEHIIHWIDF